MHDTTRERINVLSCCLSCHAEFLLHRSKGQVRHGCFVERQAWSSMIRLTTEQKEARRKTREAAKTKRKIDDCRGVKRLGNLHPCPECGTLTANRFRCSLCWDHKSNLYDVDAMITMTGGYSRQVTVAGRSVYR